MVYCAALNCRNSYQTPEACSFHAFPRDPIMREKWMYFLRRDFEPNEHSKVCSLHFEPWCFVKPPELLKSLGYEWKPALKPDAFPTIFNYLPPLQGTSKKRIKEKCSGYFSFLDEMFQPCLVANPGLTSSAISKLVAAKWDTLLEDEREKYRFRGVAAEISKLLQKRTHTPNATISSSTSTAITSGSQQGGTLNTARSTVTKAETGGSGDKDGDRPGTSAEPFKSTATTKSARCLFNSPFPVTLIKVDRTPEPMKYQLPGNADILSLCTQKGGAGKKPNIKVVYTCTPMKSKTKKAEEKPKVMETAEKPSPVSVVNEMVASVSSMETEVSHSSEGVLIGVEEGGKEVELPNDFDMSVVPHPMNLFKNPSLKAMSNSDLQEVPGCSDFPEEANIIYNAELNENLIVATEPLVNNGVEVNSGFCAEPTNTFEPNVTLESNADMQSEENVGLLPDSNVAMQLDTHYASQVEPNTGLEVEPNTGLEVESNAIFFLNVGIVIDLNSVQTLVETEPCAQAEPIIDIEAVPVAMEIESGDPRSSSPEIVLTSNEQGVLDLQGPPVQPTAQVSEPMATSVDTNKIPSPANSTTASALLKQKLATFDITKDKVSTMTNLGANPSQQMTYLKIQDKKIYHSDAVEEPPPQEVTEVRKDEWTLTDFLTCGPVPQNSQPNQVANEVKGVKKIVFDFKQPTKSKKFVEKNDGLDLIYTCNECKVAFRHDHQLKAHFLSAHTESPPFKCQYCSEMFPGTNELRTHMVSVHRDEGVRALVFDEETDTPFAIYKVSQPKVAVEIPEKVPFPAKVASNNYALIVSKSVRRGTFPTRTPLGEFCCSFCGGPYVWKRSLEKHLLRAHVNRFTATDHERHSRVEEVSVCVGDTDEIRKQNVIHKTYFCLTCAQSFNSNSSLGLHKREEHGGKYLCPFFICSAAYADRSSLRNHIVSKHDTLKAYGCTMCSYCTYRQSSILKHLTYHYLKTPGKKTQADSSSTDSAVSAESEDMDADDYDKPIEGADAISQKGVGTSPEDSEEERSLQAGEELKEEEVQAEVVQVKQEVLEEVEFLDNTDRYYAGEDIKDEKVASCVDRGKDMSSAASIKEEVIEETEELGEEDDKVDGMQEEEDAGNSQPYIYIERFPEDEEETLFTGHGLLPELNFPEPLAVPSFTPIPLKIKPDFEDKSQLGKYLSKNKNPEGYKCLDCGKMFAKRSYLGSHFRSHMPQEPQTECNLCFKSFKGLAALKSHRRNVHFSYVSDSTIVCPICHRVFSQNQQLVFHMKSHKQKPKPKAKPVEKMKVPNNTPGNISCTVCKKTFYRKQHLTFHMRTHKGSTAMKKSRK